MMVTWYLEMDVHLHVLLKMAGIVLELLAFAHLFVEIV